MGTSSNRFTCMNVFSREGQKGRAMNREALAQVRPSLEWLLKNRFCSENTDLGPIYQFVHFFPGHFQGFQITLIGGLM